MKQLCMIVLVFVCSGVSSAQDTISQNQTQKEFVKLQGDAYFSSSIPLNEVVVFADMKCQSTQEIIGIYCLSVELSKCTRMLNWLLRNSQACRTVFRSFLLIERKRNTPRKCKSI